MNVAGARHAVRARLLPLCVLLLVCVTAPMELTAQTKADRESVSRVVELLFRPAGQFGDEIAPLPGVWSVAIAKFAKGDSREIEIPVTVGERYEATGVSEAVGTDVDICVYDPGSVRIDCDTLDDNVPIVSFTAETDGVYRAVQLAVLAGDAMAVRRLVAEGADPNGTDRYGWGPPHFALSYRAAGRPPGPNSLTSEAGDVFRGRLLPHASRPPK